MVHLLPVQDEELRIQLVLLEHEEIEVMVVHDEVLQVLQELVQIIDDEVEAEVVHLEVRLVVMDDEVILLVVLVVHEELMQMVVQVEIVLEDEVLDLMHQVQVVQVEEQHLELSDEMLVVAQVLDEVDEQVVMSVLYDDEYIL